VYSGRCDFWHPDSNIYGMHCSLTSKNDACCVIPPSLAATARQAGDLRCGRGLYRPGLKSKVERGKSASAEGFRGHLQGLQRGSWRFRPVSVALCRLVAVLGMDGHGLSLTDMGGYGLSCFGGLPRLKKAKYT